MKRLTTLAAALLFAAPLFAADTPKIDVSQNVTPQDSPLVAAAKKAAKKRTGKTIVITNETLAREFSNAHVTTTESQPAITLPSPDAALIAMQQYASRPATVPPTPPSAADAQRQKMANARAARAEENGPYGDNPAADDRTLSSGTTEQPSVQTAQPAESMQQPKKP